MDKYIIEKYTAQTLGRATFDWTKTQIEQHILTQYFTAEFEVLFREKDHEALNVLLILPSWYDVQGELLEHYNRLLTEQWHFAHENLLAIITHFKLNDSTTYIERAANLIPGYLEENDVDPGSFIRKCMWALADINTAESVALLDAFCKNENAVIRQYADEQLRWLNGEKGMRYMD